MQIQTSTHQRSSPPSLYTVVVACRWLIYMLPWVRDMDPNAALENLWPPVTRDDGLLWRCGQGCVRTADNHRRRGASARSPLSSNTAWVWGTAPRVKRGQRVLGEGFFFGGGGVLQRVSSLPPSHGG